MSYTLILTVIASLVVGGAAGAGASHWLFSPPAAPQACPQDNSWKQFLGAPVQPQAGKTYK